MLPKVAGKNSGFNRNASFKASSTFTGLITVPAATQHYRIDILPSLNIFPIANTATRFMTYRAVNVQYMLIPRFNISSTPGTLPILYQVPVQSSQLPVALPNAFTAFADCNVQSWHNTYKRQFPVMMYQDND